MKIKQKINNNQRILVVMTWKMTIWVEWKVKWIMDNMISKSNKIMEETSIQINKLIQISWEETNLLTMEMTMETWMMDNQSMLTVCSTETETSMATQRTKTREKQMNISMTPETSVIFQQIM
jgi:hypothetical protein